MRHNQRICRGALGIAVLVIGAMLGFGSGDASAAKPQAAIGSGWLHWRGPHQTGVSDEKNLPGKISLDDDTLLWSIDLQGRGTPVAVGNKLYVWGYRGERDQLVEVIAQLDANTGKTVWEHEHQDFISDIIYDRYSIGAPTIDAETSNVYLMTTPGLLICYSGDGKELWKHSMMEKFGRLTFPNGRTGAPAIDGDLVIVNAISTNWGSEGPPRNRFYAFDKKTGEPRWSSSPGVGPPFLKDSSFSSPVFSTDAQGRRVFYAGIGSGAVVCINARNGKPIWRYQIAVGGINCTPVVHGDMVIATHGVQNVDSTKIGRMFAVDRTVKPGAPVGRAAGELPLTSEKWKAEIEMFTSSPVLVGEGKDARVYQLSRVGELHCLDATTGKEYWKKKLGNAQIHATPSYGDGKLYVPMEGGKFYVLKPSDKGAEVISEVQLDGTCLGTPCLWNGRVYVFTTKKLYAFGPKKGSGATALPTRPAVKPGPVAALEVRPSEVLLQPGEKQKLRFIAVDANGFPIGPVNKATVEKFIPPTAKVKAKLDVTINGATLVAGNDAKMSAGAFKATAQELPAAPVSPDATIAGTTRGRILSKLPMSQDFEAFDLTAKAKDGAAFAYPPLPWIGARFKWEVRELDGNKVFAKTLDRLILSRATTFIGSPTATDYTITADVMTEGNRRIAGDVGLVNQRYLIVLKGAYDKIEISSNLERLRVSVPFEIKPKSWYTLKTRVDVNQDGSGVVRAKAWPRGEDEPEAWTIEAPVKIANTEGAPGLFGFSPQNKPRVYIDNIRVEPSK